MDVSEPTGPRSWEARPRLARALRIFVLVVPVVVACLSSVVANRWLPRVESMPVSIVRILLIMAVSTATVWVSDKGARKLLPLAVLMQLSLVFPDQAPSRLKAALKSGSSRRLNQMVDETRTKGLSKDPGEAARQVVQLIGAVGDHDRRTRGHSERVRLYAEMIGQELKLSKEDRQKLQWGALLHDLGKLMVPPEILNKPGLPDAREWEVIRGHPMAGMKLIEPLREFLGEWADAIGGHHEKWDGTGYPQQLRAEQIPRAAAIVAVADSVEVMTAVRSYKKAMPLAEARAELTRCAGTHFSPEVVRAFLSISLGRVRLIAGPLAALSQVPYVGNLLHIPAAAAAVPTALGGAAIPVAVTALAVTMGVVPVPLAPVSDETAMVVAAAQAQMELPSEGGDITVPTAPGEGRPGGALDLTSGNLIPTTSTTPTTVFEDIPPTTTTTTTTTLAPIKESPTTPDFEDGISPPTPAPEISLPDMGEGDVGVPVDRITLMVSTSNWYLNAQPLEGASFPAGSTIYIFAKTSGSTVDYAFPGGTRQAKFFPFDMMGRGLVSPKGFVVPVSRGNYTITATVSGNGDPATITATFSSI